MGHRILSARARELGDKLRRCRDAAGLPGQILADRLGWSASKVSRIESGIIGMDEIDVVRYGAHCGLTCERIDALLDLCREQGAPGYWLSDRLSSLIFHETTAGASSSYDPLVVPGLLQTEEYAKELIGAQQPDADLGCYWVSARMERQRVLHSRPFEFFIHEQALRLPVGGNRVMNEQLLKLVLLAEQPRITIRVVPVALGARAAFGGEFVLFRYKEHRPLVYLEAVGLFMEDQVQVIRYREKIARLSDVALGRGESRELLAAVASEFDHPEDSPDVPDHLAEEQLQLGT
jgi:transcriptional regulator with XRE-family HTH domain